MQIGSDSLIDNLYMLDAICSYDEIPQTTFVVQVEDTSI